MTVLQEEHINVKKKNISFLMMMTNNNIEYKTWRRHEIRLKIRIRIWRQKHDDGLETRDCN